MFNLSVFLKGLDLIYKSGKIKDIEEYLKMGLEQSAASGDDGAVFTILNEMMGYYRAISRYEECETCIDEAFKLADAMEIMGTLNYGTLLINAATGYRAAGKYPLAEHLYKEAYDIYKKNMPKSDYRMASLHNNLSQLYAETGRQKEAKEELLLAMSIITKVDGANAEVAITHANLGNICFQLKQIGEGTEHMKEAIGIFESTPGQKDSHYAIALAGLGESCYHAGNTDDSVKYYEKALSEIERTYGQNDDYRITLGNLEKVKDLQKRSHVFHTQLKKGLQISKEYFEAYGRPMICEKYPEYKNRIAVGLVGEGSECLGFDDINSTDHDYGPGFCIWLEKSDYDVIGKSLLEDYKKLPGEFMGFPARNITGYGQERVGVFEIGAFYQQLTGYREVPTSERQWLDIPQEALRTATNGEIFEDPLGVVTKMREGFLAYPENVRQKKLAIALGNMAQAGQYNYSRAKKREDKAAMYLSLSKFVSGTMEAAYLLNRIYMPFYKWQGRGMEAFTCLAEVKPSLEELMELGITSEFTQERIETICMAFVQELNRQGITDSSENFLEAQKEEILKHHRENNNPSSKPNANNKEQNILRGTIIDNILKLEWEQFQKVRNEGGRSLCQDDYGTFEIMRKSQFLCWDLEVLESYLGDLKTAKENLWNLIMEKYARMMESTAPLQYAGFEAVLPVRSKERIMLQEAIILKEMEWAEQFLIRYPKISAKGRKIHTSEDTATETSMETYLRGELGTYSDNTLKLYHKMIWRLHTENKNLKEMNVDYMSKFYNYQSLAEAEKSSS